MLTSTFENRKVIKPPPSLKDIIHRTAKFVAERGDEFELGLKKKDEKKFSFLVKSSNFYPYYRKIVKDCRDGTYVEEEETGIKTKIMSKEEKLEQQGRFEMEKMEKILANDPFEYDADIKVPESMSPLEYDIIHATAQTVAKNGVQFLKSIAGKYANNPQFGFLKVIHPHFEYFSKLIEIYGKLISPSETLRQNLMKFSDPNNRPQLLNRIYNKAEWQLVKAEVEKRKKLAQEKAQETDWDNFVLVQTVIFEDEIQDSQVAEVQQETQQETQPVDVPDHIKSRIRKDYEKVVSRAQEKGEDYYKDPRTGELVPVSRMTEHLKYSLIDPRWMRDKQKEKTKFKTSNLPSTHEMAQNLSEFVQLRSNEDSNNVDGGGESSESSESGEDEGEEYATMSEQIKSTLLSVEQETQKAREAFKHQREKELEAIESEIHGSQPNKKRKKT